MDGQCSVHRHVLATGNWASKTHGHPGDVDAADDARSRFGPPGDSRRAQIFTAMRHGAVDSCPPLLPDSFPRSWRGAEASNQKHSGRWRSGTATQPFVRRWAASLSVAASCVQIAFLRSRAAWARSRELAGPTFCLIGLSCLSVPARGCSSSALTPMADAILLQAELRSILEDEEEEFHRNKLQADARP